MRASVFALLLASACTVDGSSVRSDPPAVPPGDPPGSSPEVATTARRLAPITGGTMLFLRNSPGSRVAVADPDGDQVLVVDLDVAAKESRFALRAGDAPRRMAQLLDGRVVVTLAKGAIALIEPMSPTAPIVRVDVCELPRGVAFDAEGDRILVACREGKLVEVSRSEARVTRTIDLPRDLRDVVVSGQRVYVTRFKSAHVLILDRSLQLLQEVAPRELLDERDTPAVAYRAAAGPNSSLYVIHQVSRTDLSAALTTQAPDETVTIPSPDPSPSPEPDPTEEVSPYGDSPTDGSGGRVVDCGRAVVASVISHVTANGGVQSSPAMVRSTLMVDMAVNGDTIVVADAGSRPGSRRSPVRMFSAEEIAPVAGECDGLIEGSSRGVDTASIDQVGLVTSVVLDRGGEIVALTNAPLSVQRGGLRIMLGDSVRESQGYSLFHRDAGSGIACASCHPEAEDDGLVWQLPEARRTPALGGGVMGTAPFHWSGDLPDIEALLDEVFVRRMGGDSLSSVSAHELADWLGTVPAISVPAPSDSAAASRGRLIYAADCASCHAAPPARSVDVGTGAPMQVPLLLGVMFRAPYMHDGCAATLEDRFGRCGTLGHGQQQYSASQVRDLVQFLETL